MSHNYLGIMIEPTRDEFLTEHARILLKDYYCKDGESIQKAYARAAVAYSDNDKYLAQRIYDAVSQQWFMFSSPILSNAPMPNESHKGLPISCFLSYVPDTLEGLIGHNSETAWLSVKGGGVGGHWSDVRAVSDKAPSPIPFLKVIDSEIQAFKQGSTRKGSYAAYLDITHPDIREFIQFKLPTGGDIDRKCLNLFNAVNLTDSFMQAVLDGTDINLIDPYDGSVRGTEKARDLWELLIETRFRTGSPYLNFIDTANRALPDSLKTKGLKIHGSNLCNEIHLPTDEKRTAVCCLSSLNIEKYEEWKDTNLVEDLVTYLDNVLEAFITNAPNELEKARYSAQRERSIGIGAMGFHGYLQNLGIPWESAVATGQNHKIFSSIKERAKAQSEYLAFSKGAYPDCDPTLLIKSTRNSHLLAVAPNANSSILCNSSSSIEPIKANAYTHRTRAGSFLVKNKALEKALEYYADIEDIDAVWQSIIVNDGSVQHLDFLTDQDKEVFKTAYELDQRWVVSHAADRQQYICQGQSVNLFFPSGSDRNYVSQCHIRAWKQGLKGLYYLRTDAGKQGEDVSQRVVREALKDSGDDECLSCEG